MKYSLKNIFLYSNSKSEGIVPQGSAEDRPLHGAPVYYYPLGRSLPDKLRDTPRVAGKKSKSKSKKGTPEKSSLKQARAWKSHYGLIDTEKLEKKQKKKKQWYQKETIERTRKPSYDDLYDAISHAALSRDELPEDIDIEAFNLLYLGKMSIDELRYYDDIDAWIEQIEDKEDFESFRGKKWANLAKKWGNNPPPIVVVMSNDFSLIGDGRGRVTYAAWRNIPVHTWALELKEEYYEKMDEKGLKLSLEEYRQNNVGNVENSTKIPRKTKQEQTDRPRKIDWSKIKKQWSAETLHPQQVDHGLFYYYKDNSNKPIAGVTFSTVDWEDDKIAHINMVGVNPKWRGFGLGKDLVRDLSKEYGYNNIKWGFTTEQGEHLRKSMEKEMMPYRKRGYDMWGRSLKEAFLNEFSALSTAAVEAFNVEPDKWERDDSPRISKVNQEKNEDFVKKLDVTKIEDKKGNKVYIDHMDPQYKRQISIFKNPTNAIEWKEPDYLDGRGEHRISKLGYAKVANRQNDLKTDVYLFPYDPNWKRSEEMVQQSVKHWIKNHGNVGAYPVPNSTMFLSIKEEIGDNNLKRCFFARERYTLKEENEEEYKDVPYKMFDDDLWEDVYVFNFEPEYKDAYVDTIKIDDPLLFSTQKKVNVETIKEKKKQIKSGKEPKVVVVSLPGNVKVIQDGHHSLVAYKELGKRKAKSIIIPRKLENLNYDVIYELEQITGKPFTKEFIPENLQNNIEEHYYHGTSKKFKPGDVIKPPIETGEMSEKGRKKNLDKVFFTKDKGSAKIYAGRAVYSLGGEPHVYQIEPIGSVEWLSKKPGTTVLMSPQAKVIKIIY